MAILKIARMGHPVLRRPATEVDDPRAPEIGRLIEDMVATMEDADGLGLAAPQVYVPLRVVIFHAPKERAEEEKEEEEEEEEPGLARTVLINPVVEPLSDEVEFGWEGCLSVPDLRGLVPRYARVRYHGLDADGGRVERVAEGLHARVVQHECDHLDGILYPMRMTDMSTLIFESELRHLAVDIERPAAAEEDEEGPPDEPEAAT